MLVRLLYYTWTQPLSHSAILCGIQPVPAIHGLTGERDSGFPCKVHASSFKDQCDSNLRIGMPAMNVRLQYNNGTDEHQCNLEKKIW